MAVKISVYGYGLACVLGAGSILLATMNNPLWSTFLGAAIVVFILSILLRKI